MSNDADQPTGRPDDTSPDKPRVHTATLSEPKATPGSKPSKKAKKERPEPDTALGKLWHNWVRPIGTVIVIVVVFRSMLLDWNDVPTGSMEPEIHVGDRIAVNRLAYGLQFPLTGPQIGIPFTPAQFDNPLDGIPQIKWGRGPQRGDIVTFWNPETDVRMVKRIVAGPGDTIAMNGGEMTINGEAATYTDIDPFAQDPPLPVQTRWQVINRLGEKDYATAELKYRTETLLGLTRTIQHIKERWLDGINVVEFPDGTLRTLGDTVKADRSDLFNLDARVETDQPIEDFLAQRPMLKRVARFEDGTPTIDGEAVSYNKLAGVLLAPYESGSQAEVLASIGLAVDGHELILDGETVPFQFYRSAFEQRAGRLSDADKRELLRMDQALSIMRDALMNSFGPVTLGDDQYYMVGDNRNNSHDSRYFGPVERSEITGEAFAVAFSFKDNQMLAIPPRPAWSRFFKDLD
jgi:signal peptidase I